MSHSMSVYVDNTNLIEVDGLADVDGNYINGADVEFTVQDESGAAVTGQSWPTQMPYVAGSNGKYRGVLSEALALVDGVTYYAIIDAVDTGNVGHWEYAFVARTRRAV
jgi:hypothetical protein